MPIQNYNLVIPKLNFNTSLAGGFGGAGFSSNSANFGNFGVNSGFNFSTPLPFNTVVKPSSSTKEIETWEERQDRLDKEQDKKQSDKQEKEEMTKPLTNKEKENLQNEVLKLDAANNKKAQSLAMAMAFPALSAVSLTNKAIHSKTKVVEMFYKDGAAHMGLYKTNPELLSTAQQTMQKLERKFFNDIKAVKGNRSAMKHIVEERNIFREIMQKALDSGNLKEIAKANAQCQTAAGVKNGWLRRMIRGFRNLPNKLLSRFDATAAADMAKQYGSIQIPKESNKFLKNMFSNKLSVLMAASMFVLPIITGWKDIKEARKVDKENKEKGVETHYGRKQITQTTLHATGAFVAYNVVDTAVRTLWKRALPKLAGKLAVKVAAKGGCKVLGGVIGSVLPGIGNLLGVLAGALFDLALNKLVFGEIKFFDNSGVKEAQVQKASDEDLIRQLSELYMQGTDIGNQSLNILMKKYGKENFKELKRVHDMPTKERNTYFAQLQAVQQQEAQQQAAQQVAQLKKGF